MMCWMLRYIIRKINDEVVSSLEFLNAFYICDYGKGF